MEAFLHRNAVALRTSVSHGARGALRSIVAARHVVERRAWQRHGLLIGVVLATALAFEAFAFVALPVLDWVGSFHAFIRFFTTAAAVVVRATATWVPGLVVFLLRMGLLRDTDELFIGEAALSSEPLAKALRATPRPPWWRAMVRRAAAYALLALVAAVVAFLSPPLAPLTVPTLFAVATLRIRSLDAAARLAMVWALALVLPGGRAALGAALRTLGIARALAYEFAEPYLVRRRSLLSENAPAERASGAPWWLSPFADASTRDRQLQDVLTGFGLPLALALQVPVLGQAVWVLGFVMAAEVVAEQHAELRPHAA